MGVACVWCTPAACGVCGCVWQRLGGPETGPRGSGTEGPYEMGPQKPPQDLSPGPSRAQSWGPLNGVSPRAASWLPRPGAPCTCVPVDWASSLCLLCAGPPGSLRAAGEKVGTVMGGRESQGRGHSGRGRGWPVRSLQSGLERRREVTPGMAGGLGVTCLGELGPPHPGPRDACQGVSGPSIRGP